MSECINAYTHPLVTRYDSPAAAYVSAYAESTEARRSGMRDTNCNPVYPV